MATINIFGNPDLPIDALPTRLLSSLATRFPEHIFRLTDPNELDLPEETTQFFAIDTVSGLKRVREVTIGEIAATKARATAHDYDFTTYLLLTQKIRPDFRVRIFGVPMGYSEQQAEEELLPLLTLL